MLDTLTKQDLISYVVDQNKTTEGNNRIKEFCEKQPPVSMVLYRGHINSREIRYNSFWYSATKSKKVAKDEFSSGGCCVFKINLVNVPVIDINKFIGDNIDHYREEDEFIFLGGGVFYKDKSLTIKGFTDVGNDEYECWYKIPTTETQSFDIDRAVKLLEYEYDIIDSADDIFIDNITNEQKQLVFEKIKEIKLKSGGKKRRTRRVKINQKIKPFRREKSQKLTLFSLNSTHELGVLNDKKCKKTKKLRK